jgi:hypothetical protein
LTEQDTVSVLNEITEIAKMLGSLISKLT